MTKSRARLLSIAAIVLLSCSLFIRRAGADPIGDPAPAAPDWRLHPFSLRSGMEVTAARSGKKSFTKFDYLTGITFHFSSWVETFLNFRVGYMSFAYAGTVADGTKISADLSKEGQFSVNNGLRIRLLDRKRIRWTVFAEYETALNGESPTLNYAGADLDGLEIDLTEYLRDHSMFAYGWHRFAAGTGIVLRLGRVSPTFAVGIERFDASVTLRLDEESRSAIRAFGYDPAKIEKRYPFDHTTAMFMPGAEIELASRTKLAIEAIVIPLNEGWVFGAGAAIVFRP